MELLYHVLPGSGMFGELGRLWHCACPEPFLRSWAPWRWERAAACGPQPAFWRLGCAGWRLCAGAAPCPARGWQEQLWCLSLSLMARIGFWKLSGLESALSREVAGPPAGCLPGGVRACVRTLHSDDPETFQGQRGRQWARDTGLRRPPACASTALFPCVTISVAQTSSPLQPHARAVVPFLPLLLQPWPWTPDSDTLSFPSLWWLNPATPALNSQLQVCALPLGCWESLGESFNLPASNSSELENPVVLSSTAHPCHSTCWIRPGLVQPPNQLLP